MVAKGEVVALAAIFAYLAVRVRGETVTRDSEASEQTRRRREVKLRRWLRRLGESASNTSRGTLLEGGEEKRERRTVELTRNPGGKSEALSTVGRDGQGLESLTPVQVLQRGAGQIFLADAPVFLTRLVPMGLSKKAKQPCDIPGICCNFWTLWKTELSSEFIQHVD